MSRVPQLLAGVCAMMSAVALCAPGAADCFAVVVGKDASADGAVLVGHNEQNSGRRFLNLRKVPRMKHKDGETVPLLGGAKVLQVKESYGFLWCENPGCTFGDSCINEWGVAVVSNQCSGRKGGAAGRVTKGGISYMLRRLIVERARTAREGIEVADELISQVGYPAWRTLIIADPNEAWLFSMVRGRHWAAQRVSDDQVVLLPNIYLIGEVRLEDQDNFLASAGLVEHAVKQGWYDRAGGKPFSFCEAYAAPRRRRMDSRQWRGQCLVTGKHIETGPDRQLPFSVKPAGKMGVGDVITILRYHGAGGLCSSGTQEAAVFQLRGNVPPDIGCVYWRTSGEPCTSVLTPWYVGITETPREYYRAADLAENLTLLHHFSQSPEKFKPDKKHAWWVFKKLQDQVNGDRGKRLGVVRKVWDGVEAKLFAEQAAVEKKAAELYLTDKPAARAYLTKYCSKVALDAVGKARELAKQLE